MFQGYYVYDVDDLSNPSPLSTLNALAARTTIDENRRQLDIVGFRLQPRFNIIPSNELLLGVDWEQAVLSLHALSRRRHRRHPALAAGQQRAQQVLGILCRGHPAFCSTIE